MRRLSLAVPLALLCAGCATTGAGSNEGSALSMDSTPGPATAVQMPDATPRLVIPAAGGMPVLSIPLGGGLYQPLTGDAPTPGIALTP
jgi:hypothetical protein